MTDKEKFDAIRVEIHRLVDVRGYDREMANDLFAFMDSLPNEPVSEEMEEAARKIATRHSHISGDIYYANDAWFFKKGAKWQKGHLWKPADGDDLPEIDREVIVLTQPYPLENSEYLVFFAHRPNPDGWDRKSITSGKIEHYTPKTYDKGGWNQPNIKWWLDCSIP